MHFFLLHFIACYYVPSRHPYALTCCLLNVMCAAVLLHLWSGWETEHRASAVLLAEEAAGLKSLSVCFNCVNWCLFALQPTCLVKNALTRPTVTSPVNHKYCKRIKLLNSTAYFTLYNMRLLSWWSDILWPVSVGWLLVQCHGLWRWYSKLKHAQGVFSLFVTCHVRPLILLSVFPQMDLSRR